MNSEYETEPSELSAHSNLSSQGNYHDLVDLFPKRKLTKKKLKQGVAIFDHRESNPAQYQAALGQFKDKFCLKDFGNNQAEALCTRDYTLCTCQEKLNFQTRLIKIYQNLKLQNKETIPEHIQYEIDIHSFLRASANLLQLDQVFIGFSEVYLVFENAKIFENVKDKPHNRITSSRNGRPSNPVSLHPDISSAGKLKRAAISFSIAIGEINSLGYSVGPLTYFNCFIADENNYKLGNLNFIPKNKKLSRSEISHLSTFIKVLEPGIETRDNLDWRICPTALHSRIFDEKSDAYSFGVLFLQMCIHVFNLNLKLKSIIESKTRKQLTNCQILPLFERNLIQAMLQTRVKKRISSTALLNHDCFYMFIEGNCKYEKEICSTYAGEYVQPKFEKPDAPEITINKLSKHGEFSTQELSRASVAGSSIKCSSK